MDTPVWETGPSGFVREISTNLLNKSSRHFVNKSKIQQPEEPLELDSQRIYSRTQRLKSDALVWQTEQSDFLGTETMNSTNQVFDEFNTNLELLKIAYKV
jgi:hypothetical protein